MNEAVEKLQAEIGSSKNNPYVKVIGEFLISHIQSNPDEAGKIMVADKTIAKSLDAMKVEARKKAVNGMAMLTDAEGFAVVLKYFDIGGQPAAAAQAFTEAPKQLAQLESATGFNVNLDDLLGGL
ncbi:hypothetical protein [Paenibacillus lutimineralis]|uniref:Uncharacterized protein n=1 Tax=Paenibacillus lutimineralis TaxID=2707005 RepID=A0A3Q9IER0_9BACL|nr:hypothetical protein [Paenibacillus lutimineralis]AZS17409.1 hypothetical protein EI981_25290 [Paenibacillus lutimineralis]